MLDHGAFLGWNAPYPAERDIARMEGCEADGRSRYFAPMVLDGAFQRNAPHSTTRMAGGNRLNPIVEAAYLNGTLQRYASFRQSNRTYNVMPLTPTTVTGTIVRLP